MHRLTRHDYDRVGDDDEEGRRGFAYATDCHGDALSIYRTYELPETMAVQRVVESSCTTFVALDRCGMVDDNRALAML